MIRKYGIILLVVLLLVPFGSYASQCMKKEGAPDKTETADYIFLGTAKEVKYDEESRNKFKNVVGGNQYCGDKTVKFEVKKQWKGEAKKEIEVFSSDGCGGLGGSFIEGHDYIIYASMYEGKLMVWGCDGGIRDVTGAGNSPADEEIKELYRIFKK